MYINHCGINFTHQNFRVHRPGGSGDYLFVYTKTPACFTVEGRECIQPKHTVFLCRKGDPQFFRGAEEIYINDYIHFNTETEEDERFLASLPLKFSTPLQLPDTERFMRIHQQLVQETINPSAFAQLSVDLLLKHFLIKLAEAMERFDQNYAPTTYARINLLRDRIYRDPQLPWTVRSMAEMVSFSPSYLQAVYRRMFRVSCMTDVICARTELAKKLLRLTDRTAREIALQCGYQNETHFSRQFKQQTGCSPLAYRGSGNGS